MGPVFRQWNLSMILWALLLRRQSIILLLLVVSQLSFPAVMFVLSMAFFTELKANGENSTPLSVIARWKSPSDSGDKMCRPTLAPPELTPNMVTLFGSPPNTSMFSFIHFRASTWSNMPQFPRTTPSPAVIKPNGPRRYWIVTRTTPKRGSTSPGVVWRAVVPNA